MPRCQRFPGTALLLLLLLAACSGQGSDIEAPPAEPADASSEAGGEEVADPPAPADAAQLVASEPPAAAPEEQPQELDQREEEEEEDEGEAAVLRAAAAAASGAGADALPPDGDQLAAPQPPEQQLAEEPAGEQPEAEPASLAEAEAEPPADVADASNADGIADVAATAAATGSASAADSAELPVPSADVAEPSQEQPLPAEDPVERAAVRASLAEVRARPEAAEGEEVLGMPAGLGKSALGRSIADGLGRAMSKEMGGGGASTRALVRRFMQRFARNMKYAVLTDSKGDMPEEERLRELRELEQHQSPEERRRLLRAIGEDPAEADAPRRPLALASAARRGGGGFRRRPPPLEPVERRRLPEEPRENDLAIRESVLAGERRAERARQRLRMLNGGATVPARRHLQMLNVGIPSKSEMEIPDAHINCEADDCIGAPADHDMGSGSEPLAQKAPPLLALGGAPVAKSEGLLQGWRSTLSMYLHESLSLLEKPSLFGRHSSGSSQASLLTALVLTAVSLAPFMAP